jgi:hypothetical protein
MYVCHSFVDHWRSRLGWDVTAGVVEERIRPSPWKPGLGGYRFVSRGGFDRSTVLDMARVVAAFSPPIPGWAMKSVIRCERCSHTGGAIATLAGVVALNALLVSR